MALGLKGKWYVHDKKMNGCGVAAMVGGADTDCIDMLCSRTAKDFQVSLDCTESSLPFCGKNELLLMVKKTVICLHVVLLPDICNHLHNLKDDH